jgi:hypothetical protein
MTMLSNSERLMGFVASLEKRHDQYLTKITKEARQHRAVHKENNPNKAGGKK